MILEVGFQRCQEVSAGFQLDFRGLSKIQSQMSSQRLSTILAGFSGILGILVVGWDLSRIQYIEISSRILEVAEGFNTIQQNCRGLSLTLEVLAGNFRGLSRIFGGFGRSLVVFKRMAFQQDLVGFQRSQIIEVSRVQQRSQNLVGLQRSQQGLRRI